MRKNPFNLNPSSVVVSAYLGPNDPDKQIELRDPDMEERITFVIEMIAFGYRTTAIVKEFCNKFGLGKAQAYRYIKTAEWEMQEYVNQDRKKLLARSVQTMEAIARRATAKGNFMAAVMASRHKDLVLGLLSKFNDTGDTPNGVTGSGIDSIDQQSARALGEIIARAKITARIPESTPVEPQ